MKKKFLALVLSISMVLSMAACGLGSNDSSIQDSTQKSESSQTEEKNQDEASSSAVEDEEPVTITVAVYDRGNMTPEYGDPTNNAWVKMYQDMVLEELNVDLQYIAIPRSNDTEKLQALIAAGDEPDIFYTYTPEQFIEWANIGVLADLSDYMETSAGQAISEFLGEVTIDSGKIDGKQYSIVCPRHNLSYDGCMIRKDWLDKVGVELETLDDHYAIRPSALMDAMIKIKDAGLCDYPFGLNADGSSKDPIIGAFMTDVTDVKILSGLEQTPEYKEAMRYMNTCYNEDLINPDFPLYDSNNLGEMVASGNVAFWAAAPWTYLKQMEALYELDPSAEYVAVEVTHEDGTPACYRKYNPVGAYGMVSSDCENVGKAVELINWFLGEDAHIIGYHGIEGDNWEYDDDGDMANIPAENVKTERINVADLNLYLNNDPCWAKSQETFERVYRKIYPNVSDKTMDQIIIGRRYSIGEGKYIEPHINAIIQSSIDYSVELSENKKNLVVGSITAKNGQFDTIFDDYLELYMKEGGSQVAEEKLELWNAQ